MKQLNQITRHILLRRVIGLCLLALLVVAGPSMMVAGVVAGSIIHQGWVVQQWSQAFFDYPLPPDTIEINRETRWGVMGGAGNHCSYYAVRTVSTDLDEAEFRAYFQGLTYPTVKPTGSGASAIAGLEAGIPVDIRFDENQPGMVELSIYDGVYNQISWLDTMCT